MTPGHSPCRCWRKSRMVGYQGLSSRSRSQRQSGAKGSITQTGLASAPARCATAVSAVITRSRLAISAAVSARSPSSASVVDQLRVLRQRFHGGSGTILLQAVPGDPRHREQRREQRGRDRAPAIACVRAAAGPRQSHFQSGAIACSAGRANWRRGRPRRRDKAPGRARSKAWCRRRAAGSAGDSGSRIRAAPRRSTRSARCR